jgi:hypothetical protein
MALLPGREVRRHQRLGERLGVDVRREHARALRVARVGAHALEDVLEHRSGGAARVLALERRAEDRAAEGAALLGHFAERHHRRPQRLERTLAARERVLARGARGARLDADVLGEHGVLRREVHEERPLRDARARRDAIDRRRVPAVLSKELGRGGEDARAGVRGLFLAGRAGSGLHRRLTLGQ